MCGGIDKPLFIIFSRRDVEPNEEICFNYQGRYLGGEGDDEDLQDEGSGADDQCCAVQLNAPVCLLGFQWW